MKEAVTKIASFGDIGFITGTGTHNPFLTCRSSIGYQFNNSHIGRNFIAHMEKSITYVRDTN
jgi:hypothetical protein